MTWEIPDVDLDVKNQKRVLGLFDNAVPATELHKDKMIQSPHKSGVYFQRVPVDKSVGLCAFPYDVAEELGYYKVDLLSNHVYDLVKSEKHLVHLINAPVDWSWFTDPDFYMDSDPKYRLTHLSKHLRLCQQYPPESLGDIAILIALIRPRKRYMIGQDWEIIVDNIWEDHDFEEGYFFKKSHAFGYAQLVIVHAQIIAKEIGAI